MSGAERTERSSRQIMKTRARRRTRATRMMTSRKRATVETVQKVMMITTKRTTGVKIRDLTLHLTDWLKSLSYRGRNEK